MSIDVFGRPLTSAISPRGPPGIGFKLTRDGHYDMERKRITNLEKPVSPNDAVTNEILQKNIALLKEDYKQLEDKLSKQSINFEAYKKRIHKIWHRVDEIEDKLK